MPLKDDMIGVDVFGFCPELTTVDLVGGIHDKTIASLHLESWRNEKREEIDRINQVLPNTHIFLKTAEVQSAIWVTILVLLI